MDILQQLIKRRKENVLQEALNVGVEDDQAVIEALEDYKYLMDKGIAFECSFDARRPDYSYMTISDGITIIMKKPNTHSVTRGEDHIIGQHLRVVVVDVDVENRMVIVANTSARQVDATRIRLKEAIDKSLARGQKVLVNGKVIGVYDKVVSVNIFEKGIEGICTVDYWRKGFVRNLAAECVLGENYDFYIVAESTDKKRKRYVLERREVVRDEWDVLAENKVLLDVLKNKGSIRLRCIERPEGKTYWWGVSDTIKGIEIMCDYVKSVGQIEIGASYKCKVDKFNLERRILRCTPYAKASGESSNNALAVARRFREEQQG